MAAGMPGRPSTSVATGKLFEYLAAERPVLVLGEDTEAARIVVRAGVGVAASEADPGSVADALERLIDSPPAPQADGGGGLRLAAPRRALRATGRGSLRQRPSDRLTRSRSGRAAGGPSAGEPAR